MAEVEKKFLSRIGVHATHYKWARQACRIREVECIIIGCRSRGCVGVPGRGVADFDGRVGPKRITDFRHGADGKAGGR